ncbi:hypothetical protein ABEB36_005918 [Hypothenemus hampei]|uniref:Major facilitator superfamily (MFS) profile domain-containing protein n=1 Tax=Hypothenemus hampei TaxID=57062 RepID=A0ABD1F303_HYPHA
MKNQDKEWPQILTIILACIPGITSALIFTWPSVFIPILIQKNGKYEMSEDEANYLPIIASAGCMMAIVFFKLPDVIGRKYSLLLLAIPQAIYWIITIFARSSYWFYVARFIGGISDAIFYTALPIYLGEVTTPKIRGTWGNGQTFSFNAGFFLINGIGSYLSIELTAYILLPLPIIFAIAFAFMPESPYYYIMKKNGEKAKQISETGTWSDLFKINSNRRALIACVFLRFAQQLAGIAVFEGYFQFIFEKVGATAFNPQTSALLFTGALWFVMTGFSFSLDFFGRCKSFVVSSLGCAICLAVESIYFYLDEFGEDVNLENFQWIPIAGLLIYVVFYGGGLGILPSLMAGELFSASIKGKALALANVLYGLIGVIVMYVFKILIEIEGLYAPFAFFSFCSFVCFVLAFYIVPETRGKTLEEIQQYLKHK